MKTRLFRDVPAGTSPRLGAEDAAALHRAFTLDILAAGAASGLGRRRLYVAGDIDHPFLRSAAAAHGFTLAAQGEGDLGARMDAAVAAELGAAASAVIIVGTDSPVLQPAQLRDAAAALDGPADLVLGPACDGGYWLVGARRRCPDLFAAPMPWGTDAVLVNTLLRLSRLQDQGHAVTLLPFLYDVDTPADLRLLAAHLRLLHRTSPTVAVHTAAALRSLGLLDPPAPAAQGAAGDSPS